MNKDKTILIISECFYPEEFKINDIAQFWSQKGYKVDVLTLSPTYPLGKVFKSYKNGIFQKDLYKGINIYRLHAAVGYKESKIKKVWKYLNFMILGSVAAVLIGRKYNYIFGFNLGALTDMIPAIIISKLYNKRVMFWVQDIWPDSVYAYGFKKTKITSKLLNIFVKFMFNNVSTVAISSKGFNQKLEHFVGKNTEIRYAPNWADELDLSIEKFKFSNDKKIQFTFAGNIGKVQNLENIVSAFKMLDKNYSSQSQLNIIGDGSILNKLKDLSKNCSNIVYFGKKNRNQMAGFYKASDFLIVSLIDNPIFSLTVPAKTQTYIAAKKPILAVIKGETANIVVDNNLGFRAEPSDLQAIKEAFQKCIDLPKKEKNKFTVNNEKLLNQMFNKDKIIKQLSDQLFNSEKK